MAHMGPFFLKVLKKGLAVSSACKVTLVETTELRNSLGKKLHVECLARVRLRMAQSGVSDKFELCFVFS